MNLPAVWVTEIGGRVGGTEPRIVIEKVMFFITARAYEVALKCY